MTPQEEKSFRVFVNNKIVGSYGNFFKMMPVVFMFVTILFILIVKGVK